MLVGHDWGGGVAYGVAQLYPSIVEKLVVINIPHPLVMQKNISCSLDQFRKSWLVDCYSCVIEEKCMLLCTVSFVSQS